MGVLPWACALTSTYWGSAVELAEVLELARAGRIAVHTTHFGLDDVAEVYDELRAGRIDGRAVICPNA